MMDDFSKHKELVNQYVQQNNIPAAIKSLLFLIGRYAEKKNFAQAESLREKIIELDSMALSEIIKANEIIEDAKRKPIDEDHQDTWADLYSSLTPDEANTLFVDLQDDYFSPGEIIFSQGEIKTRLFLINQGQAKHLYVQGNREYFIKKVGPGAIAGANTFFDASVCTTSLVTLTGVKVSYLDREILKQWRQTRPDLEKKLRKYSNTHGQIHHLLKRNAQDRRSQKRIPLSGRILVRLVNDNDEPVGKTLGGSLADISVGGLSFVIKAREKDSAQLLLGRKLNVQFLLPPYMQEVDKNGLAIGVTYNTTSYEEKRDYSVHIKLDENFKPGTLNDVAKSAKVA